MIPAPTSLRIPLARSLRHFSSLPGSLRVQRMLAPHAVNAGRAPELMLYPFAPRQATGSNPGWTGSTSTFVGWNAYFRGAYEPETLGILSTFVAPGATVIEVGANEGFHSIFAGWCVGRSGRVLAFEPNPTPRTNLRANIDRLGWHDRIEVVAAAVGEAVGERKFFVPNQTAENQGVGGFADNSRVPTSAMSLPMTTLDATSCKTCALLKLDVQGAEALVLSGGEALIAACRPLIYFEVDDGGAREAMTILRDWNFTIDRVIPRSRPPYFSFAPVTPGWTGNCLARPAPTR